MSKISVLLVEDNPLHQEQIYLHLQNSAFSIVDIISESEKVMPSVIRNKPDVIIMDIDLGEGDDGIKLSKEIDRLFSTPVIFATARTDHDTLKKALQILPVSYLVKPVTKENLVAAIELALFKTENRTPNVDFEKNYQSSKNAVFLKSAEYLVKVDFKDILGIMVEKDRYISVYTHDNEYLIRSSIKDILESLPNFFIQVHRSSIVNVHHIRSINDFESTISIAQKTFPLGGVYKKELLKRIKIL